MRKKTTVLFRIYLIFFALVIPWSVFSFCLLDSANRRIDTATERLIIQNRQNVLEDFETQMVNTYTTALLSDALKRSVYLGTLGNYLTDYERVQAANQILESLSLLNIMGKFVKEARVYIQPLHLIYNNAGATKGTVQSLSDEEYERVSKMAEDDAFLYTNEDKLLFLLKNTKSYSNCILEVELSRYDMQHFLKNSLEFSDNSLFSLQFPGSDIVLGNTEDAELLSAARSAMETQQPLTQFTYKQTDYYVYSYHSGAFNFTYLEFFPKSLLFKPVQLSNVLVLLFGLLSIVIMIIFFTESVKLIHRPLKNLTNSFALLRKGDFTVRAQSPETADFVYLYDSFNHMAVELETLVSQNYHQEILLQKAELRQLQTQINPHFLYNSFFLLQRIFSGGDTEQAEEIAAKLGLYFRYITKQNSDTVPLKDETEHAKIYADIQSIRFAERITVDFAELPTQYTELRVPKLFLQPLIENSFKYGLENKISGGLLRVTYQTTQSGNPIICVEDNGEELTEEHLSKLIQQMQLAEASSITEELGAIMNIARRLKIYYQTDGCLRLDRSPLGGMRITIRLGKN